MCLSWVQPWDGQQCAARGGEIWLQYKIDWDDLPVGREFDGRFLKNVKSPPYALPSLYPEDIAKDKWFVNLSEDIYLVTRLDLVQERI